MFGCKGGQGKSQSEEDDCFFVQKKSVCADGEELERCGDWITGEFGLVRLWG